VPERSDAHVHQTPDGPVQEHSSRRGKARHRPGDHAQKCVRARPARPNDLGKRRLYPPPPHLLRIAGGTFPSAIISRITPRARLEIWITRRVWPADRSVCGSPGLCRRERCLQFWRQESQECPESKIIRIPPAIILGHGRTGPCGPGSEIFYDPWRQDPVARGECRCRGDRFHRDLELGSCQYDQSPRKSASPCRGPFIDNGMGLERLAAVLKQAKTLRYELFALS